MATTSLAAQLQKLAIPQATAYKDDRRKASLLFTPEEAAHKDRETFYRIALTGLAELNTLYEGFRVFEDTLFSQSSKDFERSVQSREVNVNLDQNIEKFLLYLSPYLLLTPAHQTLEWLLNRYHIHEYNHDSVMALILPYHSTMIFVRIFQLMEFENTKWSTFPYFKHIKKGNPLTSEALCVACTSHPELMSFISNNTLKYVELYGERADQLSTVFSFFCQTAIAVVHSKRGKNMERFVTALMPVVARAVDSHIIDFRASAHIVLGLLLTKTKFNLETLNDIVNRLLTTPFELSYEVVLILTILYEQQSHFVEMSDTILNDLSTDIMHSLCNHLRTLVEKGNNIHKFVVAIISSVLPKIQEGAEEFIRFSKLPEILFDKLDLKKQKPAKVIR